MSFTERINPRKRKVHKMHVAAISRYRIFFLQEIIFMTAFFFCFYAFPFFRKKGKAKTVRNNGEVSNQDEYRHNKEKMKRKREKGK